MEHDPEIDFRDIAKYGIIQLAGRFLVTCICRISIEVRIKFPISMSRTIISRIFTDV